MACKKGRKLILRHPSIAHPLGALSKDSFIRSPQMAVPSITIPVLRFHVIALDGREMTASFGGRLTGWSRAIAFIPIDRTVRRTDMTQALGIRKIRRGRGYFIGHC